MSTEAAQKPKRQKSTTTKGHYVKNAEVFEAVLEAKKLGRLTNRLAGYLMMIAERYSRKSWFVNYSYREDMVASALVNLCQNWHKFNEEKSNNPFAYYTTAIHNSFQQYKHDEKKHRDIRDQLLIDQGAAPSFSYQEREHDRFVSEHEEPRPPEYGGYSHSSSTDLGGAGSLPEANEYSDSTPGIIEY